VQCSLETLYEAGLCCGVYKAGYKHRLCRAVEDGKAFFHVDGEVGMES